MVTSALTRSKGLPLPGSAPSSKSLRCRLFCLAAMLAAIVLLAWPLVFRLVRLGLQSDNYSHALVMPFISAFLIYGSRRRIFARPAWNYRVPVTVMCLASPVLILVQLHLINRDAHLSLLTLALLAETLAAFAFCFGRRAFRAALFPLLILLLCVPIPLRLLDQVVAVLQQGSAAGASFLLSLLGVPCLRQGVVLYLPGLTIEVAKQCSGIRSSMALFIVSLVMAHTSLTGTGKKILLCLSAVPLAIAKNALRIAVLSFLGAYVSRSILFSPLHRDGGVLFFLVAVALLSLELYMLRRLESGPRRIPAAPLPQPALQ